MTRILKRTALAVVAIAAAGFVAFLYVMPPLTLTAPEKFVGIEAAMTPTVERIDDPAERALAERGRYLILSNNCTGCHVTQGPQGPRPDMYLAGGMGFVTNTHGSVSARNLTPDKETGLGARSAEDITRVLRSGVYPDGKPIAHRAMPWPAFSNWSDEDLYAVVVYLRNLPPIRHEIPPGSDRRAEALEPGAVEAAFALGFGSK
jgi:mono/diheme cytochrome c family protein